MKFTKSQLKQVILEVLKGSIEEIENKLQFKKTPKYIDGEYNERWAGQSYLVSDPKVEIYPASETGDFIAVFYDDKLVGKYRSIEDAKDKVEIWKKTGTWPKSTYGGPVTDTSGRPVTGVGGRYPRRRR